MDIQGLKLAIDTGNPDFFNGNWADVLSDLVEELEASHTALEYAAYEGYDLDSFEELSKEFVRLAEGKDKYDDSVVEIIGGCSCIKEDEDGLYSISNKDGTKLTIASSEVCAGEDYEIIVRIIR